MSSILAYLETSVARNVDNVLLNIEAEFVQKLANNIEVMLSGKLGLEGEFGAETAARLAVDTPEIQTRRLVLATNRNAWSKLLSDLKRIEDQIRKK